MLVGIVATTPDGLIGNTKSPNGLPWHLKKDLEFFKNFTKGKTLIVGGETFKTLPTLTGREIIVVSRSGETFEDKQRHTVLTSLEDLRPYIMGHEINVVIGGATIYQLLLPFCDHFMVTEVFGNFTGDVFFPVGKIEENFEVVKYTPEVDESGVPLIFKWYKKKEIDYVARRL